MVSRQLRRINQETPNRNAPIRIVRTPPDILFDALKREIEIGDILFWNSSGYYRQDFSFGLVLNIFIENRKKILVLNSRKNKVTLWNTFDKVILAKHNNYDVIPKRIREIWGLN